LGHCAILSGGYGFLLQGCEIVFVPSVNDLFYVLSILETSKTIEWNVIANFGPDSAYKQLRSQMLAAIFKTFCLCLRWLVTFVFLFFLICIKYIYQFVCLSVCLTWKNAGDSAAGELAGFGLKVVCKEKI
jgi:hypothetical protein